jgi:hypothetical protein
MVIVLDFLEALLWAVAWFGAGMVTGAWLLPPLWDRGWLPGLPRGRGQQR